MPTNAAEVSTVKLLKNGDLVITEEDQKIVVAHYEVKTGHLEFASKAFSESYYNAAITGIGTINKGKEVSGLIIRSFGIKGGPPIKVDKTAPKKPRLGRLGDSAEDIVRWYLTYALPEAIIRYRIYCDSAGNPIRKKIRRIVEHQVDNRNLDDNAIDPVKDGPNSQTKAPITRERELIDFDGVPQIIAGRATALTFQPQEVVGGFVADDDFESPMAGEEENE